MRNAHRPWTRRLVLRTGSLALAAGAMHLMASAEADLVGKAAPSFTRVAFDGRTVTLADMRGHVVLLNFWASWCAPCLAEMPTLNAWNVAYSGRGLNIVGVNMDDDPEPMGTVVSRLHLNYPVVHGDAALARSFGGVMGLPVSFLIDRKGIVRKRLDGAVDLGAVLKEILALLG